MEHTADSRTVDRILFNRDETEAIARDLGLSRSELLCLRERAAKAIASQIEADRMRHKLYDTLRKLDLENEPGIYAVLA